MRKNKFGLLSILLIVLFLAYYFSPTDEPENLFEQVMGMMPLLLNIAGIVFAALALTRDRNKIFGIIGLVINVLVAMFWIPFFFSFGPGGYILD